MAINIKQEVLFPFTSADFVENPYPFYDRMRSISPVYYVKSGRYPGWYVTGYEEAKELLLDARLKNRVPFPSVSKKYRRLKDLQSNMMLFQNGVGHRRLRGAVAGFFMPKKLEQCHPFIMETVEDLLNEAGERGGFDVMSGFAFPLASSVIGKILGIPREKMGQFREWSARLVGTIDFTRTRAILENGDATIPVLQVFFKNLIAERKLRPENDVISLLVEETGTEGKLSEDELLATLILLVIAGHETTVNLIGNSILALLEHPGQTAKLAERPELIETAVEEFLRFESPTQMTARVATENVEISGKPIQKGEHVYIILGAANRDPKQFRDPHVLDISRNPNPHLSFGHGRHFCIGASLARMEAAIAIQALMKRNFSLQLADPPQWRRLAGFRSLQKLPLLIE